MSLPPQPAATEANGTASGTSPSGSPAKEETVQCRRQRSEEPAAPTSEYSSEDTRREVRRCSDELDRLGRRLDQLVSRGQQQHPPSVSVIQPSPRKNSIGSHIPAPDLNSLRRSPNSDSSKAGSGLMSQSVRVSPTSSSNGSRSRQSSPTASEKEAAASDGSRAGKASTTSMLKSTLRRMTRLTISGKDKNNSSQSGDQQQQKQSDATDGGRDRKSVSARRQATSPSSSINRSRSFRDTAQQPGRPATSSSQPQPYARGGMSNSLRRPKNKDMASSVTSSTSSVNAKSTLPRSGTGGTLDNGGNNRRSVSRSHSVQGKRMRERDMNVRKSRGVQTQLTRDVLADEDQQQQQACDSLADAGDSSASAQAPPPTSLDFTLFMPGVLGADDDEVETLVSEHTEPADVRKNRQLTLENMRLQREVERLKMQLTEGAKEKESLRRDKRTLNSRFEDIQSKLRDEEALRLKLERQMDRRDEKMREIAMSMENVEREFENRDGNIASLENRVQECRGVISGLQSEVEAEQEVITDLRSQLDRGVDKQRTLLQQLGEVEAEAKELQEFLQAEKMTLAETLKDCEGEIAALKARAAQLESDNGALEERCSHLVRLCEQRYQENLSVQAQLSGVQEKAKDMLLAQGAEISRATVHVSEMYSRLERLMAGGDGGSSSSQVESDSRANGGSSDEVMASVSSSDLGLLREDGAVPSAASSQFLVATKPPFAAESFSSSTGVTSESTGDDGGNDTPSSESLQNLSKAIAQRQRSENGHDSVEASSNGSLPSLVERIHDVQTLIERLIKEKRYRFFVSSCCSLQQLTFCVSGL